VPVAAAGFEVVGTTFRGMLRSRANARRSPGRARPPATAKKRDPPVDGSSPRPTVPVLAAHGDPRPDRRAVPARGRASTRRAASFDVLPEQEDIGDARPLAGTSPIWEWPIGEVLADADPTRAREAGAGDVARLALWREWKALLREEGSHRAVFWLVRPQAPGAAARTRSYLPQTESSLTPLGVRHRFDLAADVCS
jgi:hypothetical protein